MIYEVTTTNQADADLREIYEYIVFGDCHSCYVCRQGC